MWASNLLGLNQSHEKILDYAFELFSIIEPHVEAHTVEQFSIAEAARILDHRKVETHKYLNNWSSTGRKNYVTAVLGQFFEQFGECDFDEHLLNWEQIKIKRPVREFLNQKINRALGANNANVK